MLIAKSYPMLMLSALKFNRSTLRNDILNSKGQGKVTALTLLDVSTPFNTIYIILSFLTTGTGSVLRRLA